MSGLGIKFKILLWFLSRFFRQSFIVCSVFLLMFLLFEDLKPGFILNYFNLGKLFLVCLVFGSGALIFSNFHQANGQ